MAAGPHEVFTVGMICNPAVGCCNEHLRGATIQGKTSGCACSFLFAIAHGAHMDIVSSDRPDDDSEWAILAENFKGRETIVHNVVLALTNPRSPDLSSSTAVMSIETHPVEWLAKLCNGTFTGLPLTQDLLAAGVLVPPSTHEVGPDHAFVNIIAIVSATLYCWEYLMTFPSEIWIYFSIPLSSPHLILFVLMRYTTFISITLGLYATWHRPAGNCIPYREVATLLVQLSVSCVLGWRTIAIWQKDSRILVIVFLLLITLMLFSSLLVLSMKTTKLPEGFCVLIKDGNYQFLPLAWFYAGTVLYDTIVIVLATYRLWQHHNDVGTFPGSNPSDTTGWASWIRSQWNSLTPLLFKLTSNGVLYLAFSTVFNVVCFIVGHWNEDRAQDLMLLYSSVMWVVCQHLVLLEIKAVWGDRASGKLGLAEEETDRLIARILQASWSVRMPPQDTKGPAEESSKDPELVLSLSVDSCLQATPNTTCCRGGCGNCGLPRTHGLVPTPTSAVRSDDSGLGASSVQQIHDFRPQLPGESYDGFGSISATSDRPATKEGNTSTAALIKEEDKRSSMRHRLGAVTKSPRFLSALTKSSSRGDASPPPLTIEHPLMDLPPQRTSTASTLHRFSQPFDKTQSASIAQVEASGQMRQTSASVAGLEVADMLANMSDDAKSTALALAGMEGVVESLPLGGPAGTRTRTERPIWMLQPPL